MSVVELKKPNELREKMRKQAKASLYFFCKAVLGYKDLTTDLHMDLCTFLEVDSFATMSDGKPLKWDKLVELPRGHLKSSVITIGYAMWRVLHNPNIRILISNATATNASHFLRTIAGHFESNEIFRWLFPELIPEPGKTKWTSTELEIPRDKIWPEATFECIGVGGTAVSRHYDLQIEDDLVSEEYVFSSEQMGKIIDWHKYALSLAVSPASLQKIVVGTRWAFNDLISFILKVETHYRTFRRAATHDRALSDSSKPIWPERFSLKVLRELKTTQGVKIFAAQYMNHPTFEDPNAFDINIIRRFDRLPEGNWVYFTAIDPAISEKTGADYSAIVTVGRNHINDIFCVEAKRGRWGVDKLIEEIFLAYGIWRGQIGLETIMFQKVLMYPLREAMRRTKTTFRVKQLRPSSKIVKNARIATLRDYFINGSLWLRRNMDLVTNELVEFPVGEHDDVIDALAYAVQMTRSAPELERPVDQNPLLLDNILSNIQEVHDREKRVHVNPLEVEVTP